MQNLIYNMNIVYRFTGTFGESWTVIELLHLMSVSIAKQNFQ